MKAKSILKKTILFISLFVVSGGTTYLLSCSKGNKGSNNNTINPVAPLTPQEKLINSLTSIKKFDLDACLELEYQQTMTTGEVSLVGCGDFSDLQNAKLCGELNAEMGLTSFTAEMAYFDKNIYLDYNESHLFMTTDKVLEFVEMLPSMGLNVAIPDEIKDLDVQAFENDVLNSEPVKDVVGYYFTIDLSDSIQLIFTTDDEYKFTGIRTNKFYYKDLFIQLKASLVEVTTTKKELVNPSKVENAPTYVDFSPTFNLINGLYNLFSKRQNTLNVDLKLNKFNEENVNSNLADLNLDFTYDLDSKNTSISGTVIEKENTHNVKLNLLDKVLYANYNDAIKVSLESQTVSGLIEFLLKKIDNDTIDEIFNKISSSTNDINIVEMITNFTNINNLVKSINVTESSVEAKIDLSAFNIKADQFVLLFSFDKSEFLGLRIDSFNFNGYNGSIAIKMKDYSPLSINKEEYAALEYPLSTLEHIMNLTSQTKFRFELEGSVINSDVNVSPVSISGGLQFDLTEDVNNGYGYGDVTIIDRDAYSHNLYVDLKDKNEVLFRYNQKMKGKFKTQSVLDIADLVKEIVNEKDEHFMELFGDLIESLDQSEIGQIIANKNYGKLFASNIISNIQTSADGLSVDIDSSILGLDGSFTLMVKYSQNENVEYSTINSLEIKDLRYKEETISFKINLKDFDDSLETTRLSVSDEYFDFSDVKLLLALGINTSKVNDWYLKTSVKLALGSISIGELKNIQLDIKIKNIKGKIKAAFEIPSLPYVTGINGNKDYYYPENRKVCFYYYNDMVYGYRSENVSTYWVFGKKGVYETYFTSTLDNFLNNAIDYICRFGLSLDDWIMEKIIKSNEGTTTSDEPIHYENILTNFSYNANGESFDGQNYTYFNIGINLKEITKDDALDSIKLKLYCDTTNERLHGFSAALIIDVGLKISISANCVLTDFGQVLDLDYIDTYITQHSQDEVNKTYEKFTRS